MKHLILIVALSALSLNAAPTDTSLPKAFSNSENFQQANFERGMELEAKGEYTKAIEYYLAAISRASSSTLALRARQRITICKRKRDAQQRQS